MSRQLLSSTLLLLWIGLTSAVLEITNLSGTLQLIGVDYFDLDKHVMFCAFLGSENADESYVLDNVAAEDCHNDVELTVDIEVFSKRDMSTVQYQGVETPMENAMPHAVLLHVSHVAGEAIDIKMRSQGTSQDIDKKLGRHIFTISSALQWELDNVLHVRNEKLGPRKLATPTGDRATLLIEVVMAGTVASPVSSYCSLSCMDENGWGTESARVSFDEASYGQLKMRTDMGAVRTAVVSKSIADYGNSCAFNTIGNDAVAKVEADGFDTSGFDMISFFIPLDSDLGCNGWAGLAYVGGRTSWMRHQQASVLAHELGHNLGVVHAGLDSNNDMIQDSEYGDSSDIMGSVWNIVTFNAVHRRNLGYFSAAEYSSGYMSMDDCPEHRSCSTTIKLVDLQIDPSIVADPSTEGFNLVRLPRRYLNSIAGGGDYFLSYRAGAVGLDTNLLSSWTNRVYLHMYNRYTVESNTQMVFKGLAGESFVSANTSGGNSVEWFDMTVDSISDGVATVTLNFGIYSEDCVVVQVDMTDSGGNGWQGNRLIFYKAGLADPFFITLGDRFLDSGYVCLPPGDYTVHEACGGSNAYQVSWNLPFYGISGGGVTDCNSATAQAFTVKQLESCHLLEYDKGW